MKTHEKKTINFLLTLFLIVACIVTVSAQIDTSAINSAAQLGLNTAGDMVSVKYPYIPHTIVGLVVAAIMGVIRYFEKKYITKKAAATLAAAQKK
jgi:glycerol uptake facilitator-like aquaporin